MKNYTPAPFRWISPAATTRTFVFSTILAVVVMAALQTIGAPLVTADAPAGIVSFEFAGTPQAAQRMVASWTGDTLTYAGLSLGLDYLFMFAYATAIGLGCILVGRRLGARMAWAISVSGILAWAQVAAASLDAIENFALIKILLGNQQALWPQLARWCAGPKFLFVALGLLFVLVGGLAGVFVKNKAE